MIDSVIYAPAAPRPASSTEGPSQAQAQPFSPNEIASVDAPISQRGPQSRLDSYREISQFVDQPQGTELLSGIDIRV